MYNQAEDDHVHDTTVQTYVKFKYHKGGEDQHRAQSNSQNQCDEDKDSATEPDDVEDLIRDYQPRKAPADYTSTIKSMDDFKEALYAERVRQKVLGSAQQDPRFLPQDY